MKCLPLILLLIALGTFFSPRVAWSQELSTVNVKDLTDAQIKQLLNEVTKMGMTMEEAAQMARLRGASETQIQDIMGRMLALQEAKEKTADSTRQGSRLKAQGSGKDQGLRSKNEGLTKKEKKEVDSTAVERKIFGFDLFNNENLTFEPSVNIQTPREYII